MTITKIEPQGYCNGVKRALEIVNKAINDKNIKKPIYLLGQLIHNKHVINDLKNNGIIVIEDKTKTRLELLDSIKDGTVIFSAHGVSPKVYEKAKNKGLNIIDATCGNVLIVHKRIKEFLDKKYDCIYIGSKNHPECEGVLGISDNIHFVSTSSDIDKLNIKNDKIYVTNQTTLSKYDLEDIFIKIKSKFNNVIIDDKICNATSIRQDAMSNQPKADLCIVVGDSASSNTKKLVKVSIEKAKIDTILCEDLASLDIDRVKKANSINISSGASTPSYLVDEIINYIKNK